ncbi:hypothetical protein GN956_G15562 [Arapaima gigas]
MVDYRTEILLTRQLCDFLPQRRTLETEQERKHSGLWALAPSAFRLTQLMKPIERTTADSWSAKARPDGWIGCDSESLPE